LGDILLDNHNSDGLSYFKIELKTRLRFGHDGNTSKTSSGCMDNQDISGLGQQLVKAKKLSQG
jgi:hypothetical protein